MTAKKKRNSPDAESSEIKQTIAEMMDDFKKRTRSVYSVNGKFRSQLTECKDGGWSCQIWMYVAEGIERPVLRNIQPFATRDDAIQMTRGQAEYMIKRKATCSRMMIQATITIM